MQFCWNNQIINRDIKVIQEQPWTALYSLWNINDGKSRRRDGKTLSPWHCFFQKSGRFMYIFWYQDCQIRFYFHIMVILFIPFQNETKETLFPGGTRTAIIFTYMALVY